ncbi:unnamed protein product [Triticum turgidum subsp. durum]|uniref:Uncharacterized protein n=1 Tax=Triticum turgidum subsp. durum TaxID=4567 RepID=A0A9R1S785_TRITD|nr:unnamed protein product [Triticum turgidum subsp. durum]
MGLLKEGSLKLSSHQVVPLFLGAALPTILLFVLASDRLDEQLSSVSGSWLGNSNGGTPGTAPALLPKREVNVIYDLIKVAEGSVHGQDTQSVLFWSPTA